MRLGTETSDRPQSPSIAHSEQDSNLSGLANGLAKAANGVSFVDGRVNGSHSPHANGDATVGLRKNRSTWFGHDREEVTRILIQALGDLGYDAAAGMLGTESGCELEGPAVAAFRSAVLQGDWVKAEILLFGSESFDGQAGVAENGVQYESKTQKRLSKRSSMNGTESCRRLALAEGANKNEMLFRVRQQKYLELLEIRDLAGALMVLRQELTPLNQDTHRLHVLSRY